MTAGLSVAIALLAEAASAAPVPAAGAPAAVPPAAVSPAAPNAQPPAASAPAAVPAHPVYGPIEPVAPKKPPRVIAACNRAAGADPREIVVCAPQGYRLDPDVMTASRAFKNHSRPKRPDRLPDTSCASVGPFGCGPQAGINLIAAAMTAATMVKRAVSGGNVGEMFITNPQPTEYQLYLEAKQAREAKEAAAAAATKARAPNSAAPANPGGAAVPVANAGAVPVATSAGNGGGAKDSPRR